MLIAPSTGLRLRLALVLAAFAAFCFVAPPAVLAFGHGEHAVQCLTHADAVDHDMSTMAKAITRASRPVITRPAAGCSA
jgi:hypothetical protein